MKISHHQPITFFKNSNFNDFFPKISRMLTTSSSCTRRRDNCHLLKSTVRRYSTRATSSRNCHRSSRRTLTLAWATSRRQSRMPWSQWLRITWRLSSWHGVQRTLVRWSMDTRSTSSSRWAAKFQMPSWTSSSRSTMDIEWVEISLKF